MNDETRAELRAVIDPVVRSAMHVGGGSALQVNDRPRGIAPLLRPERPVRHPRYVGEHHPADHDALGRHLQAKEHQNHDGPLGVPEPHPRFESGRVGEGGRAGAGGVVRREAGEVFEDCGEEVPRNGAEVVHRPRAVLDRETVHRPSSASSWSWVIVLPPASASSNRPMAPASSPVSWLNWRPKWSSKSAVGITLSHRACSSGV